MRDRLRQAVQAGRFDEVEAIVSKEPKMVRHIVGLMYGLDEAVRKNCAEAFLQYPRSTLLFFSP